MIGTSGSIFLVVVIASLATLLAGSTLDMGGVQMAFARKGIDAQTGIKQEHATMRTCWNNIGNHQCVRFDFQSNYSINALKQWCRSCMFRDVSF